jgi:hypothetical protein
MIGKINNDKREKMKDEREEKKWTGRCCMMFY